MRLKEYIEEEELDKDKRKDLRLFDEAICTDIAVSQG